MGQGYLSDWAHHVISLCIDSLQLLRFCTRVGAFASRRSPTNPRQTGGPPGQWRPQCHTWRSEVLPSVGTRPQGFRPRQRPEEDAAEDLSRRDDALHEAGRPKTDGMMTVLS